MQLRSLGAMELWDWGGDPAAVPAPAQLPRVPEKAPTPLRNSFSALTEVPVEELIVSKPRQGEQMRFRKQQQQVAPKLLENAAPAAPVPSDGADRAARLAKLPREIQLQHLAQLLNCGPGWAFENKPKAHRHAQGLCALY